MAISSMARGLGFVALGLLRIAPAAAQPAADGVCLAGERCEEEVASLLQHRSSGSGSEALEKGSIQITIKAPPQTTGSPAENLAAACADVFNAADAACLGGTNSYLMHIYTASDSAYCAYEGGWTLDPSSGVYKDPSACAVSPGQQQPLFYDSSAKTLTTYDQAVAVTGAEQYSGSALSCYDKDSGDVCTSNVVAENRRQVVISQQSEELVPGQDKTLAWSANMGYVGIVTIQEQSEKAMYVKHLNVGDGLSSDVPCGQAGSVEDQVKTFPVTGVSDTCGSDSGDYYMLFSGSEATICFPGSACDR